MAVNRLPLIAQFPQHETAITAWETRFPEMLNGSVPGTAEAIEALAARGIAQYALTNLPAEWVAPVNRPYPRPLYHPAAASHADTRQPWVPTI